MKVPQYESDVKDARIGNTLIDAKGSRESFGGGSGNVAAAVGEAVTSVSKVYQEQRKKADDIKIDEIDAQLVKKETELMYDQNGALNKKGKDTFGQIEYVNTEFDKYRGELEKELTNDYQREQFRKRYLDRATSIDRNVRRHVGTEIIRYDNDVAGNLIKNEMDAAISAYNDPERVNQSLTRQTEALDRIAKNNGWSKEEYDAKLSEIRGKTHNGVIDRYLVNDQDMDAEKYFQSVKDTITGDDLTDIEKKIENGSLRGKSQRFADEVMRSGLSESQALERARQEQDPKLRDALYDRIKMEYNMKDAAKRAALEELHVNALNLIDNGRATDLTKVRGWDDMISGQRNSLIEYAKAITSGKNIQTDYNTYYNLKTMASTPQTQDKFLKMNLMEYRDKLDNSHFDKMIELQGKLRKGDGSAKKTLDGFRTDSAVVKQAYEAAGLKSTDKEKLNNFNSRVEQAQLDAQERLGRKLTNKELADIANSEAKTVVVKEGWLWDDKKKMFELSDDEVKNLRYKDVPSSDKAKIEAALKAAKKQVTEEAVRQIYIKKVLNGRN